MRSLVICFFFLNLSFAEEQLRRFHVGKIATTQEEVGRQAVEKVEAYFFSKFIQKNGYRTIDEANANIKKYIPFVESLNQKSPINGVIQRGKNGKLYARITDGHHRAYASFLAWERATRVSNDVERAPALTILVLRDYTKSIKGREWTAREIASDILTNQEGPAGVGLDKGEFSLETQKMISQKELKPESLLELFPTRVSELKDNPYRSVAGEAFFRYGIESDDMIDYIEFRVAEKLRQKGFRLPPAGSPYDDRLITEAARMIFEESDFFDYLKGAYDLDRNRPFEVSIMMENALRKFNQRHVDNPIGINNQQVQLHEILRAVEETSCPN